MSLTVRVTSAEGLSLETSYPNLVACVSMGSVAYETKLVKKTPNPRFICDFNFQLTKDSDFMLFEIFEVDGDEREPIAAHKLEVPDAYLISHPNEIDSRKLALQGGGTLLVGLTYNIVVVQRSKSNSVIGGRTLPAAVLAPAAAAAPVRRSTMYSGDCDGYAANDDSGKLTPVTYKLGETLGAHEVQIAVSACGMAMADYQVVKNVWGQSSYPFMPGHEIVGTVDGVGSDVTGIVPGDHVGLGWVCGACFKCKICAANTPQLCPDRSLTVFSFGGYSRYVRADYRFVAKVPREVSAEHAAVLFGAGTAAWGALSHAPGALDAMVAGSGGLSHVSVGIVGLGGVGHIALQMATALGMQTTVYSHAATKEERAIDEWGASNFVYVRSATKGIPVGYRNSHDLIVFTAPIAYNFDSLASACKEGGTICIVGASNSPITFGADFDIQLPGQNRSLPLAEANPTIADPPGPKRVNVVWSEAGWKQDYEALLRFVEAKSIRPVIKPIQFKDLSGLFPSLGDSAPSEDFRRVLCWSTAHLA
eukprot:c39271_g1_i1.p1 GENE.c39271_g1_i1~~c39271_g1_i1.p1  ORF type:complete len:545 (+),score=94.46 c39271_g1_i1:35-1636(+)